MLYDSYYKKISRVLDFCRKVFKHIVLISIIIALIIISVIALLATKGIVFDDKNAEDNFEISYGEGLPLNASAMLSKVRYEYSSDDGATWSEDMPIVPGEYSVRAVANTSFGGERYGKVYSFVLKAKSIEVFVGDSSVIYGELPEVKSNELSYGDKITCDKVVYEDIAAVDARVMPDKDSVKIFRVDGTDVTTSYDIEAVTTDIKINPRKIGFTVSGEEMVYNNVRLTYSGYEISSGTLAEGDTEQAVIDTKPLSEVGITEVGEFRCTPDFCIVTSEGVDVTEHYEISTKVGTLKVVERSIVVKTGSAEKVYDETELFCEDYEIMGGQGLVEGHSLSCESHLSIINADEKPNELKFRILDASGTVKTQNYSVFYEKGTLKITPRPITVNTADREWMYDNTEHYDDAPQISGFCPNHSVKLELPSIINAGEKDNAIKILSIQNAEGKDVFANYNIIYEKMGKLKITPRPITISYGTTVGTYNGEYRYNDTYKISENEGYGLADGDTIDFMFPQFLVAGEHENKPTNAEVISIRNGEEYTFELDGNNYTLTEIPGTITIQKRPLKVKPINKDKVYDGEALVPDGYQIVNGSIPTSSWNSTSQFEHSVSVTYSGSITDVGTEASSIDSISIIRKDSEGEIDVTDSFCGFDSSDIEKENGTLRVDTRPITVTSKSATKVYDGTPLTCHEYTVGGRGLVSGHTIDVSFAGTITDPGTADNTFTVNGIKDASQNVVTQNYDVTQVDGTLTVTNEIVVDLSCSDGEAWGSNGRTKVYDGNPFNISCTVKTEDGSALTDYTVELPAIVNVSDSKTLSTDNITIKYGENELDKSKLDISVTGITRYQITQREITLTPNDVEKVYDGTPLSASGYRITSGALLDGHNLTASCNATGTDVGEYTISVTDIKITDRDNKSVTSNYRVIAESGTLTIKPRPLTVELKKNNVSYTYDAQPHTLISETHYSLSNGANEGLVGDDSISFTSLTEVGSFTVSNNDKSAITINNGNINNYDIKVNGELMFAVIKREITVNLTNTYTSKIYDGTPFEFTYSVSNIVSGHSITLPEVIYFTNGEKTLTVDDISFTPSAVKQNYDITLKGNLNYQIEPRPLRITLSCVDGESDLWNENLRTKTYDGKPFEINIVSPDSFLLDNGYTVELPEIINVSDSKTVSADDIILKNRSGSVVDNNNFEMDIRGVTQYQITPLSIEVKTEGASQIYDGNSLTNTNFEIKSGSLAEGHSIVITGSQTDVGTSQNTFKIVDQTGAEVQSGNYNISKTLGTLEITKRQITVTLNNTATSKVYDGNKFAFNYSVSNIVSGHSITLPEVKNYTNGRKTLTVGDISFTPSDVKQNYEITLSGNLYYQIDRCPITVTSKNATKDYDGKPLECHEAYASKHGSYSLLTNVGELVIDCNYTGTQTNAGTSYNIFTFISITDKNGNDNYEVKQTIYGTLTVNKRNITLTTGSDEKVYDETPLTKKSLEVAEDSENYLVEDHKINNSAISDWITGSQTAVGSTANTYDSGLNSRVKIFDGNGNDVTKNYTIVDIERGTLTVTEPEEEIDPITIQIYLYPSTKYYDGEVLDLYDYSEGSYHIVNPDVLGEHMFSLFENYDDPILSSVDAYAELFTVKRLNENELWKNYFDIYIDGSKTQNYRLEIVDLKGNADSDMVVWGIFKNEIELTSASVTDHYKEGQILSNPTVELTKGSLLEGHTLTAKATGELSSVGEVKNTIDKSSVKILDSLGNDVTSNYAITYIEGTLKYLEQG